LTLSGGFSRDANRGKVRILRQVANTSRRAEIEVDLKRVLEGKDEDIPLLANDVLYVPRSYSRAVLITAGQLALPIIPLVIALALR
jgi:protein involved in polysaccharide export with SLBB domain